MQAIIQQLQQSAAEHSAQQRDHQGESDMTAGHWFGFFVEPLTPREEEGQLPTRNGNPAGRRVWIQCPESGVSYLVAAPGTPRLRPTPPESAAEAIALEPVHHQGRSWLVMRRPGRKIRVNGLPAPRIAALRTGDQVQASDEYLLHVSLFTRPYIGPRLDEHADKTCPYCRTEFEPGFTVYVCPHCRTALHCQGDEKPADDRLVCARLVSECPKCHMPVVMEEKHAYVPE